MTPGSRTTNYEVRIRLVENWWAHTYTHTPLTTEEIHSFTLLNHMRERVQREEEIKSLLFISFYFYNQESHQSKVLWIQPWVVNPKYTTPSIKTVYRIINDKLLVGIEPKISEYSTHYKPPTMVRSLYLRLKSNSYLGYMLVRIVNATWISCISHE